MRQKLFLFLLTIFVGINFSIGQTLSTGTTMSICAGTSVSITALPQASGANNYSWAGGTNPVITAGAPSPISTITVIPVSSPYVVTCYFFNGTTYITSATVTITVNPIPLVSGIESFTQCADGSFTLVSSNSPDAQMSFVWQMSSDNGISWNSAGNTNNNLVLSDLSVQNGKQYRSIVTYAATGCSDTSGVKTLTVNTLPTATFGIVTPVCLGNTVSLVVTPATGVAPYSVNLDNNVGDLVIPNNINPVSVNGTTVTNATFTVKPTTLTTYHFTITDSKGCHKTY